MSILLGAQSTVFDEDFRQVFLNKHGWEVREPVGQDSSIRRYFRVAKGPQTAILMETVPDGSKHATPGHSLGDFIRIASWLREIGLSAPEIYEVDEGSGYALLEDFGNVCFREAMRKGHHAKNFYALASEVLNHLTAQDCPLELPAYYDSHVHRRHRRVVDWYMPLVRGTKNEDGAVEQYRAIWTEIEGALPECPQGFLHVDFHVQNLMWLPDETGLKRCGILDFQGAMKGPQLYDLGNLLEDARMDVPPDVKTQILSSMDEVQQVWFRVLATQFHCRVIGQFIKQAALDGNETYLPYVPRLQNYLREGLKHPVLLPLRKWFEGQGVDFTEELDFSSLERLHHLVSSDAQ